MEVETVNLQQEAQKQQLINKIAECDVVITNLKGNPGFIKVIEDFSGTKQQLDDAWHLCSDETKWKELRITKLAVCAVLGVLDNYERDKSTAQRHLFELENPDKVQAGDYPQEL